MLAPKSMAANMLLLTCTGPCEATSDQLYVYFASSILDVLKLLPGLGFHMLSFKCYRGLGEDRVRELEYWKSMVLVLAHAPERSHMVRRAQMQSKCSEYPEQLVGTTGTQNCASWCSRRSKNRQLCEVT